MFFRRMRDRSCAGPGLHNQMRDLGEASGEMRETTEIFRRQSGAHRIDYSFSYRRRCLGHLDESLIRRHFDDGPIPGIRRDVIVDGDEREKCPLPPHHSHKVSM